jgi:hypothetical protein
MIHELWIRYEYGDNREGAQIIVNADQSGAISFGAPHKKVREQRPSGGTEK